MEDCLFYRDARLVSLNEVGGEPERFGVSVAEFHQRAATRARLWPNAMVALTTHDTKRGEDVRARIGVLSQVPSLWAELVGKWALHAPPPDQATGLFLLQNIFGVWPVDGVVTDDLRGRLHAYAEKAIREAAVHTTWNDPDAAFETAVHTWLDTVIDGPVAAEMTSLVERLDLHARSDAWARSCLALDRTRCAGHLSGHRAVGGQPGRPGQSATGGLRRQARGTEGHDPPQDSGRDGSAWGCGETVRSASPTAATRRCWPRARRPNIWWRLSADDDVLTAVTRHARAAVRNRLGRYRGGASGRCLDRPHRWCRFSGRVLAVELFADMPVALLERLDD